MSLYPLKFQPRFVEKMWGGRKLQTVLGKALPAGKRIGESWELYDFPPGVVDGSKEWVSSVVSNGSLAGRTLHELMVEFGGDLLGDASAGPDGQFPLLVKFLDAREDLSVQVHPDRAYAATHAGAHLKNEAWYIMQRDPRSRLLNGLRPGTTRQMLEQAIARGDVERLLNAVPVNEGDCFELPSGTVHALGAGILVAEVQTPSDTTFRLFDFKRIDPLTGKPRTLHVAEALECIDFSTLGAETRAQSGGMCCESFHIERVELAAGFQKQFPEKMLVLVALAGSAAISWQGSDDPLPLARGEVALLPASVHEVMLQSSVGCTIWQVNVPC